VREESRNVKTLSSEEVSRLPDTPYNLWVRGELDDHVDAPEGSRIEIIGGKVVVSPPPGLSHGGPIRFITRAFERAGDADSGFPWAVQQVAGVRLVGLDDGYIPDLVVTTEEILLASEKARLPELASDEIEMVVEVTSRWGADGDRPPRQTPPREKNKWTGYAKAEVPYYLLIDRAPKIARSTLYCIPDRATGAYLHQESWAFGETIHLPDPFDLEIDTSHWMTWES
jgi:hypothetical protein